MSTLQWHRLGRVDDLKTKPLQQIQAGEVVLALSYRDGEFGAISGHCNHAGGPLGDGQVDADGYVVCPWHHWHFHRLTGQAHAGIPAAAPRYDQNWEFNTQAGKSYPLALAQKVDPRSSR